MKPRVLYISEGETLAAIVARLAAQGVTDLSTVKLAMDVVGGCCGGHSEGDDYCYTETGYGDIRLEWKT